MHPREISKGRTPTYLRVFAAFFPQKDDPYRIRWRVGDNLINYPFKKYTSNTDMTTSKLLFNLVISTPEGRFINFDIKYNLNTPVARYKYMLVMLTMIPKDII